MVLAAWSQLAKPEPPGPQRFIIHLVAWASGADPSQAACGAPSDHQDHPFFTGTPKAFAGVQPLSGNPVKKARAMATLAGPHEGSPPFAARRPAPRGSYADGQGGPRALNGTSPEFQGRDGQMSDHQQLRLGERLYRRFNRFEPTRIEPVRHPRLIPPVVVELGELTGLMYRSDKWQPGRPRTYIHFMKKPPRLVSNAEGTQLYLVGGDYRVTPRGIEG